MGNCEIYVTVRRRNDTPPLHNAKTTSVLQHTSSTKDRNSGRRQHSNREEEIKEKIAKLIKKIKGGERL